MRPLSIWAIQYAHQESLDIPYEMNDEQLERDTHSHSSPTLIKYTTITLNSQEV